MEAKHFLAVVVGLVAVLGLSASGDPGHGEPTSVAASCGTTTASVTWEAVEDPHLAGYDVYKRASGESGFDKANSAVVTTTQYTVTGLASETQYEFRVVSVFQDAHESEMSAPATCATA